MSNEDVVVNGADLECRGHAAKIVKEFGLAARSKLRQLLTDPIRFAAAHAVLAEITNVNEGGSLGPGPGRYIANKLHYNVAENGAITIGLHENLHLQDWWVHQVGDHTGIRIWDEESEQLVWYDEWQPRTP